jgi:uncharacterized membrane protein SirB2
MKEVLNMYELVMKAQVKTMGILARIRKVLKEKNGEGFVDTAVKILMSVVIGALILSGLYLLFKDNILPALTDRINEMFNFAG